MLRDQLKEALKTAMIAKETQDVAAIRLIMAKLKDQDIAARSKGNMDGIKDDEICAMMQGMIKQRRESVAMYEKGGRQDLVDQEQGEIAVIERFLPQQMTDDEIKAAIAKIVAETGAASIKDMGKVMGALKAAYAGQMDFSKAGGLVKSQLGG